MSALRYLLIVGLLLTASGFAADVLGEYIGPIDIKGNLVFEYPEGENPITNIVFNVDPSIADSLIIVSVPSPWSHSYGRGTLTLSGGSLSPGGTVSVTVSLNKYHKEGEYTVSSIGTTSKGEVIQASGPFLVSNLILLNLLGLATAYRFPLAALVVGLTFIELFLNRRSGPPSIATVTSTQPRNCQELVDKCTKARDAAEAAEAEAQQAKQKADSANLDFEKAKKATQEAQKKLNDAKKKPSDEDESWIEMNGRRITSEDLKLRKDASKTLWDQYRQGEIDAKTLEKGWERLGDHEALKDLRKKSQEARTAKTEKALENAKKQAREAEEKLQKAKEEAESARKESDEAKALADKACEEAVECLEARDKAPTKPTVVKKEDAPEEEPATTEESEETRETTEATETYETTTETYETTTETYEETRTRDTQTTETTEALEMHIRQEWEQKRDTKFFGPRLGESDLKPKTLEKAPKESPSVEDASQSRHEYRSTLGGAWEEFWGTISRTLKMDK